jgi:magnesium transporter
MNFEVMPELHWALGYPFALVLMVAAAGGAIWFFRSRDWF